MNRHRGPFPLYLVLWLVLALAPAAYALARGDGLHRLLSLARTAPERNVSPAGRTPDPPPVDELPPPLPEPFLPAPPLALETARTGGCRPGYRG